MRGGGKEQGALEPNAAPDAAVADADVLPYLKGGALPECPSDGAYTVGAMDVTPVCDAGDGHEL